MSARHWVIGGATAVAVAVLVVTLMLPAGDPPRQVNLNGGDTLPAESWQTAGARDFLFTSPRDNGQLIEVFGQQLNPQPMGVMDVQWPGARIHLSPNQTVIEIRGRHGSFVAPDNQPQSGRFEGMTVLTLFENPGEGPLDLRDGSPHVALRVFLQNATFDLDLRTIESDDVVHLTSPQVDFRGRGMRLTYNELRRRLERLEIFEGDHVRVRRGSDLTNLVDDDKPASAEADTAASDGEAVTASDGEVETLDAAQYYRATFERSVSITSTEVNALGSAMRLTFAMSPEDVQEQAAASGLSSSTDSAAATTSTPVPLGGRPEADRPLPEAASMVEPREDDIVIKWAGRLLVEPLDEKPADIASAKDLLFAMIGTPLRIDTAREEQITAGALHCQLQTGRVKLEGFEGEPVAITTPKLGLLTVANLTIDQLQGLGWVDGAGSLRAAGDMPEVNLLDSESTDLTGLPAGTTISWRERVEIAFHRKADADAGRDGRAKLNQLESMKSITLLGDVDVQHPQMEMQAQEASMAFAAADEQRPVIDGIEAKGDVRVRGLVEQDDGEFDVQSQELTVAMARDQTGRLYPSQLIAREDVYVTKPEGEVRLRESRAGEIRIDLAPKRPDAAHVTDAEDLSPEGLSEVDAHPSPAEPSRMSHGLMPELYAEHVFSLVPIELPLLADRASFGLADEAAPVTQPATDPAEGMKEKPRRPDLEVVRVTMIDDVLVDMIEPEIRITAARVDGDMTSDQFVLTGADDAFASLYRDGATLAGRRIVLSEPNETIYINDPGTLTFISAAPDREGDDEQRQPIELTITWTEAMSFDNRNGMALFSGDVVCDAKTDRETTHLTGDSLRVRFVTLDSELLSGDDDMKGADKVRRALLDVQALGDAQFTAAAYRDEADGTLDTRLTLQGPSIVFDNLQQQVQIDSAGSMLFEDYRPVDADEDEAVDGGNDSPLSQISGRGATLFTWTGHLRIDVLRNEMLIDRNVKMVHQPMGDKRVATLACRQMIARLQGDGGLGVWLSDDAPRPELAEVLAIDEVRMKAQGRHVVADLLSYDASKQLMTISANEGRRTMVYEDDSTQPLQAQHFEWDIARNRIRATNVGVIGVQVP